MTIRKAIRQPGVLAKLKKTLGEGEIKALVWDSQATTALQYKGMFVFPSKPNDFWRTALAMKGYKWRSLDEPGVIRKIKKLEAEE